MSNTIWRTIEGSKSNIITLYRGIWFSPGAIQFGRKKTGRHSMQYVEIMLICLNVDILRDLSRPQDPDVNTILPEQC